MLADPLKLGLEHHDLARDRRIVGLRSDGVDLAVHLLRHEIQGAPDRLRTLQNLGELSEMTLQPRQFLGDVRAVGEQRHLLQKALLILRRKHDARRRNALVQLTPIVLRHRRGTLAYAPRRAPHKPQPRRQIRLEVRPLQIAHPHHLLHRHTQRAAQRRPDHLGIPSLRLRLKHARRPENRVHRNTPGNPKLHRKQPKVPRVGPRQRTIDPDTPRLPVVARMEGDPHRDAPPRDMTIDLLADPRLEHLDVARQRDRYLRLFPIHRTHLHDKLATVVRTFPASISGHRPHVP